MQLLTTIECRVLGCLIEKEMTTPEYYPLSLNALTNACNQKSNRDPIMSLHETDVLRALDALRHQGLAMQAASDGGRVAKYQHNLAHKLCLEPEELAILCELLVRGAQTLGELRGRSERMYPFASLEATEEVVERLIDKTPAALVVRLPRQPGRKECRFSHLLAGVPIVDEQATEAPQEGARRQISATDARIDALETKVILLEETIEKLISEIKQFRSEFE